ncbi:hypothetical protein GH5_04801 [Leishmania sp. Ghana 2012 LV757]|uniref:hypothetical protein n=1 Tax=Leishmania sp. Ghana 2012 LV757 TaxID=2803181 RepID=UPI001B48F1F0|nr:hypothetical protein GH5_04801 [Leishmania sp. Ghana 2012 LV757]
MEQQAPLIAAARQQEQSATGMATRTHSTNEETFDSVRQAAVVMFKQRTKDLTRLAQVETQCQTIEAELRQAQTCVTQLVAQQASLEALLEEEQQRSRQRESRLQELHSALLQLDEEQQTSGELQHSAEAAIGAATAFIRKFTNADGRLFQLLAAASARTSGRSAPEIQRLLAGVQQVLSAAETHLQSLVCLPSFSWITEASASGDSRYAASSSLAAMVSADVCATGVSHALQEWAAKTDWAQHRELADAVKIIQQLVAWLSTESSAPEEAQKAAAVGGASCEFDLPWPSLPPCAEDVVTEVHWFGSRSLPLATFQASTHSCGSAEVAADDDGLRGNLRSEEVLKDVVGDAIPSSEAVQLVLQQDLLAPLQAILTYNAHLVAVCAQHHLQLPEDASSHAACVVATQQRWVCFHAAWQQWREDVLKAQAAVEAAIGAEAELGAARAALLTLRESCEEQSRHYASRMEEVVSLKEAEVSQYAAAWLRGVRTLQMQRNSLSATSNTIASLTEEASALTTALHDGSEHRAHADNARGIALSEQHEKLTATRQRVKVVKARVTSLEAECAEAQRVQQVVRDQHVALVSCATACLPPSPSAAENGVAANVRQPASWALSEMPVAKCAASVALTLLQSTAACSSAHTAWTERLVELSSEVDGVAGEGDSNSLLTASVSQFFENLMVRCRDARAASRESGSEPALDPLAVRLAIEDTAAGLRLPTDLFLDDVVDAELLTQMPHLRILSRAEEAIRASAEEHRVFMSAATAEISLLRSELETAEV